MSGHAGGRVEGVHVHGGSAAVSGGLGSWTPPTPPAASVLPMLRAGSTRSASASQRAGLHSRCSPARRSPSHAARVGETETTGRGWAWSRTPPRPHAARRSRKALLLFFCADRTTEAGHAAALTSGQRPPRGLPTSRPLAARHWKGWPGHGPAIGGAVGTRRAYANACAATARCPPRCLHRHPPQTASPLRPAFFLFVSEASEEGRWENCASYQDDATTPAPPPPAPPPCELGLSRKSSRRLTCNIFCSRGRRVPLLLCRGWGRGRNI